MWRIRIRPIPGPSLGGHDHQSLLHIEAAGQALFQPTQRAFIDLDPARQHISSRSDHSATQLVQHGPGGLVLFQPQHTLQPQGTGSVLLRRYPPHGTKPNRQRNARVLENGPCGERGLPSTLGALPSFSHWPSFLGSTAWTAKPGRPSQPRQVHATGFFRGEFCFQLHHISRILFALHQGILDIAFT